ncbi:DUF3352 domain-containing protein [Desulforhopalus sp. IMCC35007]|uniref:DUF3352 domain-containing protein n=1 Tax=Desulforhopalus sp. IMCC35007 TaxID=2569543 RepID=UPI0010AE47D3|nr:DUF3352 domain-containing protein [Desulforhopalus sp. IMCC35007]TKB11116.1 DUF3352 domain-containing protein [Desulforhopalus sp. IMCC35007]
MNTNAFVTFSSILLVVVYLLVWRYDPDHEDNMAKFIPDNALIFFEQRNAPDAIDTFKKSQLGKNFTAIDFRKAGNKINLSEEFIDTIETIQHNYSRPFEDDLIDELLGRRFAFALFWPQNDFDFHDIETFFKDNSVILAKPRHSADLLKFLAEHYSTITDGFSYQIHQYGNHQISRMSTPEGTVSLSVIEGLLLFSFNEKRLKTSIDTYDKEIKSLHDTVSFRKARQKFKRPERFIYLPVDTIRKFAAEAMVHLDPNMANLVESQIENTMGFTGLSYAAWPGKNLVEDKLILSYEKSIINSASLQHLQTEPVTTSMLELTTGDPLVYYWSNAIDLRHLYTFLVPDDDQNSHVYNYFKRLEELSGISTEEILSVLGQEVSLVVEKNDEENFIPVPLGVLLFKIDPHVDVAAMANNIVNAFGLPVVEKLYNSVTYLYWVASPQDGLQPLCGYWSNYLFVGNSALFLERVIDGFNNDTSLLKNPKVKAIDPGITEKNNSITYFNNVEIIELTQRLLSALGTIVSLEDKTKAQQAHIILNEVVNPLLNGIKEYERSCTRSYFAPGMVVIESKSSIAKKENRKEAR